jgi:transposase-like protein
MRYSASEKFEIIELVEQSSLSIRRTLAPIGIPRSTFYEWYSRYQEGGIEALEDGKPKPRRIWNKIPDKIETAIVNLALEEPDLSPRELAVNFTDTKCESACKKDPLFGVIGFQSGPRNRGSTLASMILGSRGWDAGRGDDCKDPPRVF